MVFAPSRPSAQWFELAQHAVIRGPTFPLGTRARPRVTGGSQTARRPDGLERGDVSSAGLILFIFVARRLGGKFQFSDRPHTLWRELRHYLNEMSRLCLRPASVIMPEVCQIFLPFPDTDFFVSGLSKHTILAPLELCEKLGLGVWSALAVFPNQLFFKIKATFYCRCFQ